MLHIITLRIYSHYKLCIRNWFKTILVVNGECESDCALITVMIKWVKIFAPKRINMVHAHVTCCNNSVQMSACWDSGAVESLKWFSFCWELFTDTYSQFVTQTSSLWIGVCELVCKLYSGVVIEHLVFVHCLCIHCLCVSVCVCVLVFSSSLHCLNQFYFINYVSECKWSKICPIFIIETV